MCSECQVLIKVKKQMSIIYKLSSNMLSNLDRSNRRLFEVLSFMYTACLRRRVCSYRVCKFKALVKHQTFKEVLPFFGDGCWHPDSILTLTVFQSRQFFTLARPYIKYMLYSLQIFILVRQVLVTSKSIHILSTGELPKSNLSTNSVPL